jgi:hypothetical protein
MLQMVSLEKGEHLLIIGDGKVSSSILLDNKTREQLLDLLLLEDAKEVSKKLYKFDEKANKYVETELVWKKQ